MAAVSGSSPVADRKRRKRQAASARRVAVCKRTEADLAAIEDDRRQGDRERWELRDRLRKCTKNKRQKSCGLPGKREDSSVTLRLSNRAHKATAGFAGLFACGNVWTCPHCSRKIAAARATELERIMAHYLAKGGYVVLVTLTLRHNKGHRLDELWQGIAKAWGAVTGGRAWQQEKQACDLAGWVRATEITHGYLNGWHPHLHVPLIFHRKPSREDIQLMTEGMFARWSNKLVQLGFEAPDRDNHGLDVQYPDLSAAEHVRGRTTEELIGNWSRYVCKGLATETTLGAQKEAKNGNRTTMQLLRDALTPYQLTCPDGSVIETTDETALALWHEYERVSKGRRQLEWCRDPDFKALRESLAETSKQDDEEIAETEIGTADDDIAVIPADSWYEIAPRAWALKHAAEQGGREAAWRWLQEAGITWYRPHALSDNFRPTPFE